MPEVQTNQLLEALQHSANLVLEHIECLRQSPDAFDLERILPQLQARALELQTQSSALEQHFANQTKAVYLGG